MRKSTIFAAAIAATLIATGFGMWAASPTNASVPPARTGLEPFQLMMNANDLPSVALVDFTFVF
jgi:hypothetical protein